MASPVEVVTEVGYADTPLDRYMQYVDASEVVVEVTSVYVRYLSEINTIDQTFKIAVDYDFEWPATEKDFKAWEEGPEAQKQYTPEVVPSFVFPNAKECSITHGRQANGNPFKLDVASGKNCVRALVEATSIVLYDLHSFPFDCQSLDLTLEMTFKNVEKMIFTPTKKNDNTDLLVWNTNFSASPDFTFSRALVEFNVKRNFSLIVLRLQVTRKPLGYLFRIALPLCLLSIVAVVAFGFRLVEDFGDRVSYLITLILTFVAFAFVINQQLPQVPYLTLLDKYNLTCFTLVVVLLVVVAVLKTIPVSNAVRAEADVYTFICFISIVMVMNVAFLFLAYRARAKELTKLSMTTTELKKFSWSRESITATPADVSKDSTQVQDGDSFVCLTSS